MKKCKILVAVVLVFAICAGLSACGIKKEEAVGTWYGTYEHNGSTYAVGFELKANNEYRKVTYKNDEFYKAEDGTWKIDGGKVAMHPKDGLGTTTYKYKNGNLVNNNHEFVKQ